MFRTIALTLALASMPALQKTPDFTGTWIEDESARKITPPPQAPPAGQRQAAALTGPPPQLIITQSAQAIHIERPWQHGVVRHTYRLDGSESVNKNGANTMTTRSRWDAGRLITEGTSYSETSAGESTWKFKEVRAMDARGAMVLETSNIDEAGKLHHVVRVFRKK